TCRRGAAEAQFTLSSLIALRWRYGRSLAEDIRFGSMAAGAGGFPGDFELLEFRRLSGAPCKDSLSSGAQSEASARSHAEWLGPRGGSDGHCHSGAISASRWQRGCARRAATVHGVRGDSKSVAIRAGSMDVLLNSPFMLIERLPDSHVI